MGVVAQCTHLALNEKVAIKMLRSDVLRDADAVERFTREAQAAAKLKSEYVAHVSDVGRFENGVPYMVMEFLEGLDLDQLIDQRGFLPVGWTTELMLQTAEALAEAHSIGIVHRDVKPSNLFVTWRPDGTALVKVLDFGISKSSMGTDMQLTQTQSLLGTPSYMSPEQMRSARLVDGRTDIWSLGTVMYEVLEGRKPFEAESFSEMCVKVAVDQPAPMVNTPLALQPVILRCLAKSPEQRYATMADFGRDLIPFATDQHQAALLVERMHRMLRRSQGDWEGQTTGSGATLQPLRDSRPGLWQGGSQPAGRPYQTPVPGTVLQPQYPERSNPYVAPSTDLMTARSPERKRRSGLWIALTLFAVAAGITIGVVATGGGGSPQSATRPAEPIAAPIPTPDLGAAKPADVKPDEQKPVDLKPAIDPKPDPKPELVVDPKPIDKKRVTPTTTKRVTPKIVKTVKPTVKEVKPDPVPPKPDPTPANCDPFDARQKCGAGGGR